MADLTGSKRTEVIKNALAVYHWFVRQALTGSTVVARKPTGEEVAIETAELAVLEGKGNRLSPEEFGLAGQAPHHCFESGGSGADQRASHSRLLWHLGPENQRYRHAGSPPPQRSPRSFS